MQFNGLSPTTESMLSAGVAQKDLADLKILEVHGITAEKIGKELYRIENGIACSNKRRDHKFIASDENVTDNARTKEEKQFEKLSIDLFAEHNYFAMSGSSRLEPLAVCKVLELG